MQPFDKIARALGFYDSPANPRVESEPPNEKKPNGAKHPEPKPFAGCRSNRPTKSGEPNDETNESR